MGLLGLAVLVVVSMGTAGRQAWAQTALMVVDQGLPADKIKGADDNDVPVDFEFVVRLVNITTGLPDPHNSPPTTVQTGFTTVDGGPADCFPFACATAGKDYVPTNGVLTFLPGETVKTITVPVHKRKRKTNQVFFVLLLTPANAIFQDPFGLGRITKQVPPKKTASTVEATEFSPVGMVGHPGGMVVGADDRIWMTEQFDGRLVAFNVFTQEATEYPTPPAFILGTLPPPLFPFALVHFITVGPDIIGNITPGDSNLWFTTLDDQIGPFDIETDLPDVSPGRPRDTAVLVPHLFCGAAPTASPWMTSCTSR